MLISALLIIAAISGFCIGCNIHLKNSTDNMLAEIDKIQDYVVDNDFKSAKKTFSELKNTWEKKEVFIQLETEHNELDFINEQFAVLSSHFDNDEYDEFFEALYKLEYFINHITEKKQLNLKTIL